MTEQKNKPSSINDFLTPEQIKLVRGEFADYARQISYGYLYDILIEGKSLEEVHQEAMSDPWNTEHHPAYERAHSFLLANAVLLGIKLD